MGKRETLNFKKTHSILGCLKLHTMGYLYYSEIHKIRKINELVLVGSWELDSRLP